MRRLSFVAFALAVLSFAAPSFAQLGSGIGVAPGCSLSNLAGCTYAGTLSAPTINVTGAAGVQQNGVTVFTVPYAGTTNAPILIGQGAGAALPSTATFDQFAGQNSGLVYNNTGAGEIVGYGPGSCSNLNSSAVHDTCIGVYAMDHETTGTADVATGGDVMRNSFGVSSATANGSYAHANYFGQQSNAFGASALRGNAASGLVGGTPSTGDAIPITITCSCISGGSSLTTYTVTSSDTTNTILANSIATALRANSSLGTADIVATSDQNATPGVFSIEHAGTAALDGGTGTMTMTVGTIGGSGSHTETITITGGVSASATRNNAYGFESLFGSRMTTASYDNGYGAFTLANLTTGQYNNCGGDLACQFATTSVYLSVWGDHGFNSATTAYQDTGIGGLVGQNCTTCRQITLLGYGAGSSSLVNTNNVIILTDGSACDTNSPNQLLVCGGGGTFLNVTGTNTSSTAQAAFSGSLKIGSTTAATLLNGDLDFVKTANSATAPGAGNLKLEVLAGTTGGSCKIVALAGTSATPVTIADNIGSGC